MHESRKYRVEHGGYHLIVIAGIAGGASLLTELAMIVFLMGLDTRRCFGWLFLGGYLD